MLSKIVAFNSREGKKNYNFHCQYLLLFCSKLELSVNISCLKKINSCECFYFYSVLSLYEYMYMVNPPKYFLFKFISCAVHKVLFV